MKRNHSKVKNIEKANILLEQRMIYKKLTEACQRAPIPKADSSNVNESKSYRSDAIKVKDTLVSSGKFTLITENDGCGNYEQDGNSSSEGYFYYGPLDIPSDPTKIIQVDGSYNLENYILTKTITCLLAMKCGCGKVVKVILDPNESYQSMITKINSTGFVKKIV